MTISGLAPWYQGRVILPVLGKVSATRYTDRVQVRLVSGQSAAEVADRAENLAHGFGVMLCRVRTARSGAVLLADRVRPGGGHSGAVRMAGLVLPGAAGTRS